MVRRRIQQHAPWTPPHLVVRPPDPRSSFPASLPESERLGRCAILSADHANLLAFVKAHPEERLSREAITGGWKGDRIGQHHVDAFVRALAKDGVALQAEAIARIFPRVVPDRDAAPEPTVDAEAGWGAAGDEEPSSP